MNGRALIVDDNRVNRMVLRHGLADQGVDAIEAENGQQALDALASEPVDVILLDLLMPVLDGYATLERIKADEALRHLPVIVITAVEGLESVVRCIELGATDYLPKPFNAAVLRARVGASLAGKRLRDLELEYLEPRGAARRHRARDARARPPRLRALRAPRSRGRARGRRRLGGWRLRADARSARRRGHLRHPRARAPPPLARTARLEAPKRAPAGRDGVGRQIAPRPPSTATVAPVR